MATNTFVTVDQLARDASLLSNDRLRVALACSRSTEQEFANKKGDVVKVQVPAVFSANEFTSTTTEQAIAQTSQSVTIEKHFEVTVPLTSKEKTLKLDDFNKQVTVPAVNALVDKIEAYLLKKMHGLQLWSGTGGTAPSTIAHIVAGRKVLQDAKLAGPRFGLISTTTEASLLQLAQFQSRDYAADNEMGVREGMLGKRFGIEWIVTPNASGFSRGDIAGTIACTANTAAGSTTLALKSFTDATGTVYAGTHFTIAGDTTVYVVTADAVKASNAATVSIYPPIQIAADADDVVTIKAAATDDFLMVGGAMAAAILPPAPLAVGSAIYNAGGIGLRVSQSSSTSTLSDQIVFDVLCGAQAVHPYAGAIWQA